MEENSISIINRTNGQVIGEKAQALPVELKANFSWMKIFFAGFFMAFLIMFIFVMYIKRQVVVVEASGKADTYTEYQIQ